MSSHCPSVCGGGEPETLKCKITSIQFDHQERSDFLWLKNSCRSDTFIGKQKDGVIAVLKIKENGFVSRFVLDPSLTCAFWDNEEIRLHCQHLYAQRENGAIVMYTVDEGGVTETVHIPQYKLASLAELSHSGLSKDCPFHLIGCDQGLVILNVGSAYTTCVQIASSGVLQVRSLIPLPQSNSSSSRPSSPDSTDIPPAPFVCHAVNGLLAILDSQAYMIFLHSIQTGNCVCQIDLHLFSTEETILDWRLSNDHSVLILLDTQLSMTKINLLNHADNSIRNVNWIDSEEKEKTYKHEHYKNRLCHFGDSAWRKEAVNHHVSASQYKSKSDKNRLKHIGFKAAKSKKSPVKKAKTTVNKDASIQSLKLNEIKSQGWTVIAMETSSTVVTLLVHREMPLREKAVCFANFSTATTNLHRLPEPSCIAMSNVSSHQIIWTEKFLLFISPDSSLQKDDLITWMMAYSGPGAADSLCQANQWTRTTIPLSALISSLQQRQLETLTFFFKSKQGLFSNWKQSQQPIMLRKEIQEMEGVLDLVSRTVADGIADSQSRIFARRLLSLTVDFLYSLLEDAKDCLSSLACDNNHILEAMKGEIQHSCTALLKNVSILRKHMHLLESRTSQIRGSIYSVGSSQEEVDSGSDATLEQYVKENRLSKLQALLQKNDGSVKTYRQILSQLLEIIKKYLRQKDISSCQHILNNLGCEYVDTLWRLSQFYTERDLQDFITGQLSSSASLTAQQREVVDFMHQLYQAYPNGSFDNALKVKNDNDMGLWTDKHKSLKSVIAASNVFLPSHCGELCGESPKLVPVNDFCHQSDLYTSLPLAWLKDWTNDTKTSILIEAELLKTVDGNNDGSMLTSDPQALWQFLASHNLLKTLEDEVTRAASQSSYQWPGDPVTCVQLGWSHLQKEIISLLLRLKKLNLSSCKSRDVDMQLFLRMVGGPLQHPHPLAYAGSSYLKQFHNLFINYCIRCGLQLPLWMYCMIHGIDVDAIKTEENPVWFRSFRLFFSIPRDPTDTSSVLLASQIAAAELWSSSSPTTPMSVEAMLNEEQVMAAIATLSYMKQEDVSLSSESLERYLHQFPKLKSILIPESSTCSVKPKMSVYQLLLGNVPFNIRRLFGWHATNSLAGEDSPIVMPQFSDASASGVVPTQQKLAFTYYLKQGRPMYAFLSLLVDELEKREESISEKRIHQACGACLWVAVQNFWESRITSACVVFVEMLGRDSGLVRTMVHAGRILLSIKAKTINPNDNDETRLEKKMVFAHAIAQELQACVQSRRRFGPKLIQSVQRVIEHEIKEEKLNSSSFEASQKWTMVNMLCHLLRLPLNTVFLQACAQADNWLMFVWFAQLHQYPTQQLQGLLHGFRGIHYRDHLHYVLNNAESKLFSSSSLSSSVGSAVSSGPFSDKRNSISQRSALYNKIGVKHHSTDYSSTDEEEKVKETPPVLSSFSSRLRHSEFHESEMPESMAPDDVFRMLFHSQLMPCQWRCLLAAAVSLSNPLFAELAACCGCPAIPSVCGWLLASLSPSTKQEFLNQHGQMVSKWGSDKLETLVGVAMDGQREDALATVFFLMQNKSPLYPFFCFINECMERGHHAASKTYIDQFKDAMSNFESPTEPESPVSPGPNGELATIGDRAWVEKVAYQVILHILKHTTCIYRACRFLELLDKHNLNLVFRFEVLHFRHLHQVVKILHDNEITGIDLVALQTSGTKSLPFEAECEKAMDFLLENGKFSQAMELAKVADISKEKVILGQLKEEKQRLTKCGVWTAKYVRAQFWEKSCQMMKEAKCSLTACERFFQSQLESTTFEYEKALLCQHWFSLLEGSSDPSMVAKRENIFRNMWRHRIAAKMSFEEQEALDHIFDNVKVEEKQRYLKSDLVLADVESPDVSDVQEDLSRPELEVLDALMGSYLDQGQVTACARVAAVFGYYNQDLAIIETCIALSCGKNSVENIEPAMRRLVSKMTLKRRLSSINKSRSFSSCSLDSVISDDGTSLASPSKLQETISVMEKLSEHCKKGRQVCRRIITCFKIAQILELSYQEIVQAQEFETLHRLLLSNHSDTFFLAKEFLSTSGLLDEEVTEFLAGLILETLKAIVSRHTDSEAVSKGLNSVRPLLKSSDGMEVFGQFIKLSENASLLGDKILQAVASLVTEDGAEMIPSVLTVQTEMIILSHDCYTHASNMEGISHVLRAARVCCHCLAQAGEFSLMIRLLTGVGRYSEMQYVFHLLQQHHQFELLLRKGMDREDKLKVAILEYLKRYQPEDNEAYSMVALKFSMYRDIAGLLENCGNRALRRMKIKILENNKETQESLRKCLQYFQEAAESYVKDMSVRKAQRCIKMARLLSLQQQLLATGTCVINLSRDEVINFVSSHTRFIESMVVTDAYEQKVNWRDAIYNNVLIGGDMRYLQELKLHVTISSTLVEDVLHKYKRSSSKSGGNMAGVRKLLSHCKDAQLQYKLSSELGLTDVVSAMLKGDTGNYLQDVTIV